MSEGERYQGWANWATWCVTLWARNEEPNYHWWMGAGRRHAGDPEALAEYLARELPENVHNADMSPADYLDVHWGEVAAACLEDVSE
jgi:hypothetical protein